VGDSGVDVTAPTCQAVGCRALILRSEVFCSRHLRMVQSDTRRVLERTFRPGRKSSKVFAVNLARAIDEILYFQMEGHRVPRLESFEW
jgi:hypothetical protein